MNFLFDWLNQYQEDLITKIGYDGAIKKIQKLRTVIFQVFYPLLGQPNHSRNKNNELLKRITVQGLIETYKQPVFDEIQKLKERGDKSAPAHKTAWKEGMDWLSNRSDYSSGTTTTTLVENSSPTFLLRAPNGKGLSSNRVLENPERPCLIYAVKAKDLSDYWRVFLTEFENYCQIISPEEENRRYRVQHGKQNKEGMRLISFTNMKADLFRYLGWLTRFASNPDTGLPYDLGTLTVKDIYNLNLLSSYITWHLEVRKNTYTSVHHFCNLAVKLAQYHLQQECYLSRENAHPIVQDLMRLRSKYNSKKGAHPQTSIEAIEQRMLEHHECEQIVEYLRKRAKYWQREFEEGRLIRRTRMEDAWQDYILIALLTYGAMRIREIEEMELDGKRLYFEQGEGIYWCCLFPAEHKTSGDREYPLFPGPKQVELTKELSEYLQSIRPSFDHQFVFFKRGTAKSDFANRGQPVKGERILSPIVKTIMYNASRNVFGDKNAKAMCPHDFRRSSATWFAHYGHMEDVLIFAQLHGHSSKMLMNLYAQVRSKEQTKQATNAFKRTSAREQAYRQQGTQLDNRVWINQFCDRASTETIAKVRVILEQGFSA